MTLPAACVTIAPVTSSRLPQSLRGLLSINFLVIGPITHDLVPDGFRFGGTVSFASVTAHRLGWRPAILTRVAPEGLYEGPAPAEPVDIIAPDGSPLAGIPIHLLPSSTSTTFINLYRDGVRTQVLTAQAEPVTPDDLPAAWADVPVVLWDRLPRTYLLRGPQSSPAC